MSAFTILQFCIFIFTFFFMLFSLGDTFYNLQCLIRFHYNLLVTLRRYRILHSPWRKRKCSVNYNQTKCSNIFVERVWFFLPSVSTYFQATDQNRRFSSHIVMDILSMTYYNYFVTKRISYQYSIQNVFAKLQATFPNKKNGRTCHIKVV